ncbi:MAG: trypsin-like peptidase domain-containing protein [Lachnospiraceae bacterium]|nr:trypsin-like peptidase domain-containing protein [Lachnospiraceae bacterium]
MYENENQNQNMNPNLNQNLGNYSNCNGTYQTASTAPQMRINPAPEPPKKKGGAGKYFRKLLASISFGLCFGLFAGLGLYAVNESTNLFSGFGESVDKNEVKQIVQEVIGKTSFAGNTSGEEVSVSGIPLTQNITAVTTDVSEVVGEVMPAMVSIINNYVEKYSYFGQVVEREGSGSGSGIIVGENDTELLIATNYHVVDSAVKLTVNFTDGSNAEAVVKGTDADMDLAVIAIPLNSLSEETKEAIAIARLGDSDSLKLGEPVIAIGNALGIGQSVSGGYVSALNREVTMEDGSTGTFIQTDAAINQGNSGGALLNINGEVIGINSSKIGGELVEGMGFAIPISAAQPILEELMLKETRSEVPSGQRGYIGISLQTVTQDDATRYGMPRGIYVYEVFPDSGASKAGLLRGDIITKFDGTRIKSNDELQELLEYYSVGETVEITIMRSQFGSYEEMTLSLTLGQRPQ